MIFLLALLLVERYEVNDQLQLQVTQCAKAIILTLIVHLRVFQCDEVGIQTVRQFQWFLFLFQFIREEAERITNTNIVICTPGRLLHHMDETAYFNADNLQMLGRFYLTRGYSM